jgi:tryptophan synthase alpha chain
MSSRIEEKFADLSRDGRKGLVTYIMAGDPDMATAARMMDTLPQAGADFIEIGFPFSDPMADGPTIQAAALRSLRHGTKLKQVLHMTKTAREKDATTPYILMGYYNPVYNYGIEKFCKEAIASGIDGVILVDLPPEEEEEFVKIAAGHDLKLIRLIAPTTDDSRLAKLNQNAGGFLYYISVSGITGTKSAELPSLKTRVESLKTQSKLPIAVGFGIKTPKQAAEIAAFSDAVVVGSALVEILAKQTVAKAIEFVKSLREALDNI